MQLEPDVLAKIAGPIISALIGGAIKIYAEGKSSLISFIGHVSAFTVANEERTVIHTHSVVVRNAGRKVAKNVRLTHAVLPLNITVYPPVQHSIERGPDNSGEIIFSVLVPKEQVTISYMYFPPLLWSQINSTTKSDDGFAKIIKVIPSPQPNGVVVALLWTLVFVGASFTFYWLTRLAISLL